MLWLRADPEAMAELRRRSGLLMAQGIQFMFEPRGFWDVIVAPLADTPEYMAYRNLLKASNVIYDPDPLRALTLAIAYPAPTFRRLSVGVDVGPSRCGMAAMADWVTIEASSGPCKQVPRALRSLIDRVPHVFTSVVLGDGPGWQQVAQGLLNEGIRFTLADERGTSSDPLLPLRLRDRDAKAALSLILTRAPGAFKL